MIKIKNIIQLTPHDDTNSIEMVYSIDDGSAKIVLDVRSDPTKNPTLIVGDQNISVTTNPFEYEIPSSLYVNADGGVISFTVTDSEHEETPMFRIQKSLIAVNSTMTVKAIDDRNFQIRVYQEAKSTAELTAEVAKIKADYYALQGGIQIPQGADLNDYKTPGNYICPFTADAPTLLNCPIKFAFTMKVEYGTGKGYPMQTISPLLRGYKYVRTFFNDVDEWTAWSQTADAEVLQNYYSLTTATDIPRGANLNNYKTPGNYACQTNNIAASLNNCPTNGNAFSMKVDWAMGHGGHIIQTVRQYTYGSEFVRRCNLTGGAWTGWLGTSPIKEVHISNSCIYRVGNMVSWTTAAWQSLASISIPVGYRPKAWNVWIPGTHRNSNHCTVYVQSDGVVRLYNNTMAEITGGEFLVNGSWATIDAMPA